jgi:hypothetical protein
LCGDAEWTEQSSKGKELNVNERGADKKTTEMRNVSLERSANIIERIKV